MYSKKGETYKQLLARASAEVKNLKDRVYEQRLAKEAAIKASADMDVTNPRTGRSYKEEAELMFQALALIEEAVRTNKSEYVPIFARECLHILGFELVSLYENKATKEGAYNG